MGIYIAIQGKGRPLVLFHGWGFDHKIWLPLVHWLKESYQLYLVDLPGFGLSKLMEWHEFKQELCRQLPRYFALLGWSLGGLYATRLACEEVSRVTHLFNVATSPYFMKEKNWPGIKRTVFANFVINVDHNFQQATAEFIALQLQTEPHFYHVQSTEIALKAGLQVLAEWDLREPLLVLNKPTCYMFGYYDAIIPKNTLNSMQKKYPQFDYFMFTEAAHAPFLSHTQQFITILQRVY